MTDEDWDEAARQFGTDSLELARLTWAAQVEAVNLVEREFHG